MKRVRSQGQSVNTVNQKKPPRKNTEWTEMEIRSVPYSLLPYIPWRNRSGAPREWRLP